VLERAFGWGLMGYAYGYAIVFSIRGAVAMPVLYARCTGMSVREFWSKSYIRPILVSALVALVLVLLKPVLGTGRWPHLFAMAHRQAATHKEIRSCTFNHGYSLR
jgi:hypothetical protein